MSESKAVVGIKLAASRREKAEQKRREATDDLRKWAREAQSEGMSISEIARAARLSRQGVYDLLRDAQPS